MSELFLASLASSLYVFFAVNNIDYVAPPALLRFEACSARECVDIGIIDDKVLEENEIFTVTLMLDSGASKDILLGGTTTAQVTILDTDGVYVLPV